MIFVVVTNLRTFTVDLFKETPLTDRGGFGVKKTIASKLKKGEKILEVYEQ